MRFQRTAALVVALLLYVALGPWVVLAAAGALAVPRVRDWLRPTWRVVAGWAAGVLVVAGLVLVIPDGWLPIPPGPGALVTPRYLGRPAAAHPIRMDVPQHPGLSRNGTSSMHDDAWASDTYPWSGPLGESPDVDTAWFGLQECATLAFDSHGRLVGLCGDRRGPTLEVIDQGSLHPLATKRLPDRPDGHGTPPWEDLCGAAYFYLDDGDRAVVGTTDRHVLVVSTDDAEGNADLTTRASHDLSGEIPEDDCLVALVPDWQGRIWWATRGGRVGTVDTSGRVRAVDLGEQVANSMAVDRTGVYVVTTEAVHKLRADAAGGPAEVWRSTYDRGSGRKSGQLSQGSGTTPTILPGNLVATTDNADPRMHVEFRDTRTGRLVCSQEVFGDDESATENSLVSVGTGVIVENNHGYNSPLSTILGRTTDAGLARVDVHDGTCSVRWTSDLAAPTSVPKVSLANGLLYAYTKPHSWWGANAWYVTALDVRTGRRVFAVRTGLGTLFNNHYSAITIAPDGSLYVATLAGLVRVRDRGVGD
ncbi:hypothetical protein FB382_004230 [Nocardioides ginsengisegetis]|uniref:PQQ-like domain-containing protein n=1 Tax=Nocardioides ginsengisegetis TaxID=661491 RepID=A0A7W3J405_9ACTN|nr:hypothetical protein [Nocardioides ginsengisegetis]MBA8805885.1 hypothetical protein [Nocardioides ginsengisegetis]